jgi:hypothetical protein
MPSPSSSLSRQAVVQAAWQSPPEHLAAPFHNMARRSLSMRSIVVFGSRSAHMAYTGFRDMTALVSVRRPLW